MLTILIKLCVKAVTILPQTKHISTKLTSPPHTMVRTNAVGTAFAPCWIYAFFCIIVAPLNHCVVALNCWIIALLCLIDLMGCCFIFNHSHLTMGIIQRMHYSQLEIHSSLHGSTPELMSQGYEAPPLPPMLPAASSWRPSRSNCAQWYCIGSWKSWQASE